MNLTATVTPDLETIDGQVSWTLEGDGATLTTDYLTPTTATLTAVGFGEGTVTVEYSFGGKTVSDEMTYSVNGVLISPRYLEISIGQEVSLTTQVAPTGGTYDWSVVDAEDQVLNIGTFDPDDESATDFTGTAEGSGWIKCVYVANQITYTDKIPLTVQPDEDGPEVYLVSCDPEIVQPDTEVTITLQFTDYSGVDTSTLPTVTVTPPQGQAITVQDGAFDQESLGLWTGTVTIPSGANEGLCLITVNGAKDLAVPQNTMVEATFSAPEIDSTAPVAVSDTNEANGFFVSPCYFKGKKPADAVDVLWRYNGDTESTSVQAIVDAGGDSVVADTWWWTEISLEHELSQGQTTNVTSAQRAVEIEIATVDAVGNISTPASKTLNWNITHIGDGDHLIQQNEKMILAGPADPGQLPSGDKTITITGDDIPTPLSATYTDANTPNWIVEFDTEGNHRAHTATITLDADSSTLSSTSTDIHVIKKLHVEVVGGVPAKPTNWVAWAKLAWQMLWTDGAWVWNSSEYTKYALLRVPRTDSYTAWADYALASGEELDPPWWWNFIADSSCLWWSDELPLEEWQEVCIRVTYDGCTLAHDTVGGKPRGGSGDETLKQIIIEVVDEMEKEQWTPQNPADPGAFGKEVHRRCSLRLKNVKRFYADVYVDSATLEIRSVGGPPAGGVAGTTQIDAVYMQKGSQLKSGATFRASDVTDLYEIKGSASGTVLKDQERALKEIMAGRDIKRVRTHRRYVAATGWGPVQKYNNAVKILGLASLAGSAYAMINYTEYDDEFEELCLQASIIRAKMLNGYSDDLEKHLDMLQLLQVNILPYLGHFVPEQGALDIIKVSSIYRIMGSGTFP